MGSPHALKSDSRGGSRLIFRSADPLDLTAVISWVADADDCLAWAGPMVSFPLFERQLKAQIDYTAQNSFSAVEDERVVAFGQLLRKAEHHFHLARLIVAPQVRGRGYGGRLCRYLIERARYHKCEVLSLNVYRNNQKALSLYRKIGFEAARATDGQPLSPDVVHMRYRWPEPALPPPFGGPMQNRRDDIMADLENGLHACAKKRLT